MIKQTLFIILAITIISCNKNRIKGTTKEIPKASERVHADFDEIQNLEVKKILSQKNSKLFEAYKFEIVPSNDNFRLVLDLAYAKKSDNPTKSHVKRFYNFAISSEFLKIQCDFDFSVYSNLFEKNSDFENQMKECEEKLSHVSVFDNEAVIEHNENPVFEIEKIQLDEAAEKIIFYETVNWDMFNDEIPSELNSEVREEITKVNPDLLKNLQIALTNGNKIVSHSPRNLNDEKNTTGTDKKTKYTFSLTNTDLNMTEEFSVEYFGDAKLSENTDFQNQISDFIQKNESVLGVKIAIIITRPKIEAYTYNEPIIYMDQHVEYYPSKEAYTLNPTPLEKYESFNLTENKNSELIPKQNLGSPLLGAPKECDQDDKALLVGHYESLLNSGRFNGMLYRENIVRCSIQRERGDLFRVVLRFNGEDCSLNLYSLEGVLRVQDGKAKRDGNFIVMGSDDGMNMRNCAETRGSSDVRREVLEVRN